MFQNLLFDLDGTLTNSAEGITKCVQYALRAQNIEEPDLKKLEVFIGPPLRDSFIKYYGMTREEAEAGVEKYRERYTDIGIWENKVYPGIMELLADRIAERFGFNPYLEDITGCSLDGKTDKKALVVAAALEKWQLTTPEAKNTVALIGDRREDVLAAHANGIACIGAGFGFGSYEELSEAGADYYVADVPALARFLLNKD